MPITVHISREQARRLLAYYHFMPTDLPGMIERLRTVQYDPLNPVGRNPDLVFQARIPGYQVDDWQKAAYTDRLIYDAWDKQACLVPTSEWAMRALVRSQYRPYHDREILLAEGEAVAAILAAIDAQGPLSPLEIEDRSRAGDNNSWYGTSKTKRILRSLWASGEVVTHHRKAGRHYYDRPERVIPTHYFSVPLLLDSAAYHRWLITQRHQATGLLRKSLDTAMLNTCAETKSCRLAIEQLVEEGVLTVVLMGEKQWPYYALTSTLELLDKRLSTTPRMIFLAPLDNMLWDRKGVLQIFDFDYLWEVYKPEPLRKWGYYVLPVFYKDRFVARMDSRLEKGVWTISRWWWEPDVMPDAELLDALRVAVGQFLHYLRADAVRVAEDVDVVVRKAICGTRM